MVTEKSEIKTEVKATRLHQILAALLNYKHAEVINGISKGKIEIHFSGSTISITVVIHD